MFRLFKKKTENYEWLVVGLGNPGDKYQFNRHNIGWMVADSFVAKHQSQFKHSSLSLTASMKIGGDNILVVKPTTFMNRSGDAVMKLIDKYFIQTGKLIVIIDEYNFPLGKVHVKDVGGTGGHNGMASILESIGEFQFLRLRCGIDKNFGPGELVDYVLSDFAVNETAEKDRMISKAVIAIEHLITQNNNDRAMSDINSGKLFNP